MFSGPLCRPTWALLGEGLRGAGVKPARVGPPTGRDGSTENPSPDQGLSNTPPNGAKAIFLLPDPNVPLSPRPFVFFLV